VFICGMQGGSIRALQPHAWVKMTALGNYPFPAANHKIFPLLKGLF